MSFTKQLHESEFMSQLDESIQEAIEHTGELAITISLIHRDRTGTAPAVIDFGLESMNQGYYHECVLSYDKIGDLFDFIMEKFQARKFVLSPISLRVIYNALLSCFEQESDSEQISEQIHKLVHHNAIYQGLGTHVEFIFTGGELRLEYRQMAEIYADTREEDTKFLRDMGIDVNVESSPHKMIPLFEISTSSFSKLTD